MSIINKNNIEDIKNAINAEIIDFLDPDTLLYSAICNHSTISGKVKGYEGKAYDYYTTYLLLINNLWDDLTSSEKEQIREVLNG